MSMLFTKNSQLKEGMLVDGTMDGVPFVGGTVHIVGGLFRVTMADKRNHIVGDTTYGVNTMSAGVSSWRCSNIRLSDGKPAPTPRLKPAYTAVIDGVRYSENEIAHDMTGPRTISQVKEKFVALKAQVKATSLELRRHASLSKKLGWKEVK